MIRINQLKMPLKHSANDIPKAIAKALRIKESDLIQYNIYRESLDARKDEPKVVYTVDCTTTRDQQLIALNKSLIPTPDLSYTYPKRSGDLLKNRPVVIGFGPAGIFAAYLLAEMGLKPIVLERGSDADRRANAIEKYWEDGTLNPETNVQFGEGGAGTFSDGKLTTRTKDLRSRRVLEVLVEAGAPSEIMFKNKPHIGTDLLLPTVKRIRQRIVDMGGEVRFESKVTRFIIEEGALRALEINGHEILETQKAILAIGHSARDTFEALLDAGIELHQKPFAMGVRIEHLQSMVNQNQYGEFEKPLLERYGAAEYQLTSETESGRSVYTFCMCPGGYVVGSASERDTIVTNGMSKHARDQRNANSALLVNIRTEDFGSDHPLAGVELQRSLERAAFELGGKNHCAPVMTVGSFMDQDPVGTRSEIVEPTYKPGVLYTDIRTIMPEFITHAIQEALPALEKKLKGFSYNDAVMTGVETRSSSPVRIVRDADTMESSTVLGLYPCGEGAGYAGGIMSSACDGLKSAEKLIESI